jgi:hypothetical protein
LHGFNKIFVPLHPQIIKMTDTMALAIKAIPTLYGDEARRFRDMADEVERKFDTQPQRDRTQDPRYRAMRTILERSNIKF